MSASGRDVTASATHRLAAGAVLWLRTTFPTATWTAGPEPDTAAATWRIGDSAEAVVIRVGRGPARGDSQAAVARPGRRGFGRHPFGVAVQAEGGFGGMMIASRVRTDWCWGTDGRDGGHFFDAEIAHGAFD